MQAIQWFTGMLPRGASMLILMGSVLLGMLPAAGAQDSNDPPDTEEIAPPPTTDQRITAVEKNLKEKPADPDLLASLAEEFIQKYRETSDGSYVARAEAACEKALASQPNHYPTHRLLPGIYNIQHRFAEAAELARKNIERNRGDYINHARLGDALLELGQYDDAEEQYLLLSFRAPKAASLPRLARLTELRGNPAAAARYYLAAIERAGAEAHPEPLAWLHVQLGNIYFSQGQFDEAAQQHAAALEAFPNYPLAIAALAQVRAAQEKYDEALALYQKCTAIAPLYEPMIALAELYEHLGKPQDAQRQLALVQAVEKINAAANVLPDAPSILFQLEHGKDPAKALELAETQARQRQDVRTLDALAWARYHNGKFTEALAASDRALRLGTRDATYHFRRGMILAKLGRGDEAAASLRKALEINPGFHLKHAATARRTLAAMQAR